MALNSILLLGNLGGSEITITLVVLLLALIPKIFYCITLKKTLLEIAPANRKMPPNNVFLLFIPLFSLVWNFIVVNKMTESLELEFRGRNLKNNESKPGYSIGMAHSVLACCTIIPLIGIFLTIAGFVCWIIYWVKINDYHTLLLRNPRKETDLISEIGKDI